MSDNPNRYPEGKLNPHDEGTLMMSVHTERGNVRVDFGKPVAWFALPPQAACDLAALLIRHARAAAKASGTVIQVQIEMSREAHRARHQVLHDAFDELLADYLRHDRKHSIGDRIEALMRWSHEQTRLETLAHDNADYAHNETAARTGEAIAIIAACRPFLARKDPSVAGAALADLLATLVAGHAPEHREALLRMHLEQVRELIPVNDPWKTAGRCRIAHGGFRRYVIVHAERTDLAWSGSQWVPHEWGSGSGGVQVSNFESFDDARANAEAHGMEVVE